MKSQHKEVVEPNSHFDIRTLESENIDMELIVDRYTNHLTRSPKMIQISQQYIYQFKRLSSTISPLPTTVIASQSPPPTRYTQNPTAVSKYTLHIQQRYISADIPNEKQ